MEVKPIYDNYLSNMNAVESYFSKFQSLANQEDDLIEEGLKDRIKEVLTKIFKKSGIPDVTPSNFNVKIGEKNTPSKKKPKIDPETEKIFEESQKIISTINLELRKELIEFSKFNPRNYELLSRGAFLMLNNYFEYLLADLLSLYYNKYSTTLSNKEFKISLKDLEEYSSISELKDSIILKEVETIIVEKSFDELLEHFETRLSVSLEKDLIDWKEITEIRERRHLIVHNSSLVNKKYISRSGNPFNLNVSDAVHVDQDYFLKSLNLYLLAGRIILFNCWGKWDKEHITDCIYEIMIQTFEDLLSNRFELAITTSEFAEKNIDAKDDYQEDYLFRIKINKLIALKKLNKVSELERILKTMKFGTVTNIFKVAFYILKDDHENYLTYLKKAIRSEELTIDQFQEWPLFDFVREKHNIIDILELFKIDSPIVKKELTGGNLQGNNNKKPIRKSRKKTEDDPE